VVAAPDTPSRARRRGFGLVVALVATFGAVTACSDDGPPTPAISGESPGEVTIPTLPPTTTSATGGDPASDTTQPTETTVEGGQTDELDATDSSAPQSDDGPGGGDEDGGEDSPGADTVPPTG
jgi:hypothetical protein